MSAEALLLLGISPSVFRAAELQVQGLGVLSGSYQCHIVALPHIAVYMDIPALSGVRNDPNSSVYTCPFLPVASPCSHGG